MLSSEVDVYVYCIGVLISKFLLPCIDIHWNVSTRVLLAKNFNQSVTESRLSDKPLNHKNTEEQTKNDT